VRVCIKGSHIVELVRKGRKGKGFAYTVCQKYPQFQLLPSCYSILENQIFLAQKEKKKRSTHTLETLLCTKPHDRPEKEEN